MLIGRKKDLILTVMELRLSSTIRIGRNRWRFNENGFLYSEIVSIFCICLKGIKCLSLLEKLEVERVHKFLRSVVSFYNTPVVMMLIQKDLKISS